jgi:excisionase family DNA binding protein
LRDAGPTAQDVEGSPAGTSEVMTADEVAAFLGVDRNTVYEYAARGTIPHRRLGKRMLFHRGALVAGWIHARPRRLGRAMYEGLIAAQDCLPNNEVRDAFAGDYSNLAKLWEAISPDPMLAPFETDYRWLADSGLRLGAAVVGHRHVSMHILVDGYDVRPDHDRRGKDTDRPG